MLVSLDFSKQNQVHIYQINDVLNFGRYKGLTIADIIGEEGGPDLLLWYLDNIDWFEVSNDVEQIIWDQSMDDSTFDYNHYSNDD